MGTIQSTPFDSLKHEVRSQLKVKQKTCVPSYCYRPFPEQVHTPGDQGLVLQIKALPSCLVRRTDTPEDTYWWVDAQFLPYNDAELVITSSAFTASSLQNAWHLMKWIPGGRIIRYDCSGTPLRGHVLSKSGSSVYPKVQLHPLGEAVAYASIAEVKMDTLTSVNLYGRPYTLDSRPGRFSATCHDGSTEVVIDNLTNETLYCRPRDLDNRCQRFCAISPNGLFLAVLSRSSSFFYVEIFELSERFVTSARPHQCHKLSQGFVVGPRYNDHVECKWSPDSSLLAISSSSGKLFLVKRTTTTNVCDIFPNLIKGQQLSSAGAFDFDPRVPFSVLAVGSTEDGLLIVRTDADEGNEAVMGQVETDDVIDCVAYCQDGSRMAVSFRSFSVKLHNTDDLSELQVIDLANLCGRHVSFFQGQGFPTVNRLSFTYDGRFLATSCCDGFVRVWSTPRLLTLQEWCRKAILQQIPVSKVIKCDLPEKIKSFLLSKLF